MMTLLNTGTVQSHFSFLQSACLKLKAHMKLMKVTGLLIWNKSVLKK